MRRPSYVIKRREIQKTRPHFFSHRGCLLIFNEKHKVFHTTSPNTNTLSQALFYSNMRTFTFLALFLAIVSSSSADCTFRRLRLSIEEVVHEKYLDLANLVTSRRTLKLVEERRNLRQRKMMGMLGMGNFNAMSDRAELYDMVGTLGGITTDAPTATEEVSLEEDQVLGSSMSLLSL